MLIQVEPTVNCVEAVEAMDSRPARRVLLTPQGKTLNQPMAENFATHERVIVLCGRYEGFDQRVVDILQPEEISIGDFVLNGGEVAAMVLIDAVVRLLPGVLGDEQSNIDDSFSRGNRMLEFPQYTRLKRDISGPCRALTSFWAGTTGQSQNGEQNKANCVLWKEEVIC